MEWLAVAPKSTPKVVVGLRKLRKPAVYMLSVWSDIPRFVKTEEISSNKVALNTKKSVSMAALDEGYFLHDCGIYGNKVRPGF